MVKLLRHRQTKGAETARFTLRPPRHIFTLPILARADFKAICSKSNSQLVVDAADRGLDIDLDVTSVAYALGISAAIATPTKTIHASDPKPWFKQ